jgi:hypothetical protein
MLFVPAGDAWWEILPAELCDSWRRQASSKGFLFTPSAADLRWPADCSSSSTAGMQALSGPGAVCAQTAVPCQQSTGGPASSHAVHEAQARVLRCCLARVLFWARWGLGEPVIVREAQVGFLCVQLPEPCTLSLLNSCSQQSAWMPACWSMSRNCCYCFHDLVSGPDCVSAVSVPCHCLRAPCAGTQPRCGLRCVGVRGLQRQERCVSSTVLTSAGRTAWMRQHSFSGEWREAALGCAAKPAFVCACLCMQFGI